MTFEDRLKKFNQGLIIIILSLVGIWVISIYTTPVNTVVNDSNEGYKTLKLGEGWREFSHTPIWYYSGVDLSTMGQGVLTRTGYAGKGGTSIEFRVIEGNSIIIFEKEYRVISLNANEITLKEITGN